MNREEGFIRFEVLMMLSIMSLGVFSLLFLISSGMNYYNSISHKYEKNTEIDIILKELTHHMQYFCNEESDVLDSETYKIIESNFSKYQPLIMDVSSGINRLFLEEAFVESSIIKKFLEKEPSSLVNYGWIPVGYGSNEAIETAKKSFYSSSEEELFPLVNYFPVMNIHFISEQLIEALLTALQIPNSKDKAEKLFRASRERVLQDEDIMKLLNVKINHPVIRFLGVKTAFWKVILHIDGIEVHAVYAAIPYQKENSRQPEKYVLVEKRIHK